MKILLISSNTAKSPYPVYPLGLSMVAAAAEAAGHEVSVFDVIQDDRPMETLAGIVAGFAPDVAGISVRNIDNVNMLHEERYVDQVSRIAGCIRRCSAAKVVLGGPAFSIMPRELMRVSGADFGIAGEGEAAFVELLGKGEAGCWPPAGTILHPEGWMDPGDIPSPLYDRQLLEKYLSDGSIASVQTKRGCPHRCVYCSYPALEGAGIRPRRPDRVVDDIKRLRDEHNVSYIFFTDSVFNDDGGAYLEVLEEMLRRKVSINWSAFFKPSGVTAQNVALMAETGLKAAELGSDAACDVTLRGQRKDFDWMQVVSANDTFRKSGVAVAHYFMFGGPGETERTVGEGIRNIESLDCSAAFVFMGIRILPDTELYGIALRDGVLKEGDDMLSPLYYISPGVERRWLETALTDGFAPLRHVLFPPDALDDKLQLLHKLGHSGALWDLLGGPRASRGVKA